MRIGRMATWSGWALVIALAGCGGPEARKADYAAKAAAYIESGNFPKARVALRNVLKIDPKDAEAYFLFAQVEEREQNWRNAFGNYLRVVELNPDHRGALIKLGKFYLEAKAYDKVTEVADKVLQKNPKDPGAATLKAAVVASKGDMEEALSAAEEVRKGHPTDPDVAILLAILYSAKDRLAEAESVLRGAVTAHPKQIDLQGNLASVLIRQGHHGEAEQTLLHIVELEPNVFEQRVRLASFYDLTKQRDRAEGVLREAIRLDPQSDLRRLALAEFLATRKDASDGEAALLEARAALPNSTNIPMALGTLYEAMKQPAKARAVYDEVVRDQKRHPAGLDALVKLAALDFAEGKREQAEQKIHDVLKENPRAADALVLQGKMALDRRDGKEAVTAFRTVLKDQPNAAEVHGLLGQAYLLTGDAALARESLEKASALNPRYLEPRRLLAGLDAAQGRPKEAQERLEAILKLEPKDVGSLGMLFNLQLAGKEWGVTEATIQQLREAGAGQVTVYLAEGNFHQAKGDYDRARAAFERALEAGPDSPTPLYALTRLDLAQGKQADARARLIKLLESRPDHPYAHGMLGEVFVLAGDPDAAVKELKTAAALKPDWLTPWLDHATLYLTQKNQKEAVEVLKRGLAANPRSEELRLLLAASLSELGDIDQAIAEYERMLKQNPKSLAAANNLAVLLADKKGDRASLERALDLSRDFERLTANPYFLDTLGWVYVKLGQGDQGVRVMRKAVEQAPEQPLLNYHLGMAYYRAGAGKEAKTYLERAMKAGKPFVGAEEAKAVLATLHAGTPENS
jgi:tetratricopeptide (TPR) repeat protein